MPLSPALRLAATALALFTNVESFAPPPKFTRRNHDIQLHELPTAQEASAVEAPSSVVYYEYLDPSNPTGVVCARGVCVIPDDDEIDWSDPNSTAETSVVDKVLNSYLGPRLLLAFASILYGTNFPLGAIMNEALTPSAATSARMLLASLALSPFLFKLEPKLAPTALLCGCFTALGYITQSLSLVDTSPAKVAFLGAATVLVCPTLEVLVNKKDMSLREAPQTWLAAVLCLVGVGILELYDPSGSAGMSEVFSHIGWGDFLAILQAVGFGTSFFITERMMTEVSGQALPITAVQVSVSAFLAMVWSLSDGWIGTEGTESYGLPMMFIDPNFRLAACAVLWTGFMTTAMNRFVETTALGKMKSAEASVILATEPLWAALFAALWLKSDFGANDYVGGALIVAACLATALKKDDFDGVFDLIGGGNNGSESKN
jgi:drug/metabolite transporter (DMT)-like permease